MRFRLSSCCFVLCLLMAPAWATVDLKATFEIRQKCERFDAQNGSATRKTIVALEMSHEGSEISALTIKGQTRKYFVTHLGTMGRVQETIYLEDGRPLWITQIKTTYDAPLSGRVVGREEENLYFQNGRLIQRDFYPAMRTSRRLRRRNNIHQTFIASPAQEREWKNKEIQWRERIASYQSALKAKP